MELDGNALGEILAAAAEEGASDVFLSEGKPMFCRQAGRMKKMGQQELTKEALCKFFFQITCREQQTRYLKYREVDFTWEAAPWRYRIHVFRQQGRISFALRILPRSIPALGELGQASLVQQFMDYGDGLLLVTGATGAGKTTTVAAFLAEVGRRREYHILTLEDPVEYVYPSGRCLFSQQELGGDFVDYASGIVSAMRENPDVIMIAELRDGAACAAALSAASSGHYVIATMHTGGAVETVERFISMFPVEQQELVRSMLASSLRGICSQKLFRGRDGRQYCGAELLHSNNAVANIIRKGKYEQLKSVMQSGADTGMQTMEMAVDKLYEYL